MDIKSQKIKNSIEINNKLLINKIKIYVPFVSWLFKDFNYLKTRKKKIFFKKKL